LSLVGKTRGDHASWVALIALQRGIEARHAIRLEADLELTGIGILVKDDVVILTGHACSSMKKCALEQLAKRIAGVRRVVNDIRVCPPDTREGTDTVIACTVVRTLEQCADVPLDRVKVVVSSGWVTLEGGVERYDQCEDAEEAVRQIVGVTGVTNLIVVKPTLAPEYIKPEIEARLKGIAHLETQRIAVEVRDGKAILRGQVRSRIQRAEVWRIAWRTPGIYRVETMIEVAP
jgi:osmotically-inducible protein OsmY